MQFIQSGVADSQIARNSVPKNIYSSTLIPLQSFYCLGGNILLTGVVYLIIDIYNFIWLLTHTTLLSQCANEVIKRKQAVSFQLLVYCVFIYHSLDSDDTFGRVCETASYYLISMFCCCSTLHRLSYKQFLK